MTLQMNTDHLKSTQDVFAHVGGLANGAVTVNDLGILAYAEVIGQALYEALAEGVDNPQVQALLRANGREEFKHAQRVSKAIEILTGEPFPLPQINEMPFYTPLPPMEVTKASLAKLAEGEAGGQMLYGNIAASFDNAQAAEIFALNGKEELDHAARLHQAAALLPI